ncbi:SNARE-binding exocyst subunit S6 [Globomyces sp. JEL0801]|nr:SNARE-binding exocyst subunit S6 [Globomyces sp. JEL0801]
MDGAKSLIDITAVDFVQDAHEAAILRIADMLRHPDDLATKLPMLKKKNAMERASIEAQLKTVMETQLDATQKGIDALRKSRNETSYIKTALQNMDSICGDADNNIKNYPFIQKISRTHQNFTTTKLLTERFQKMNQEMNRVSKLLDEDCKRIIGNADNLLLVHNGIHHLVIFRNQIMRKARGLSSDVMNTLANLFKKLEQLESKFEDFIWNLAKNTIELVKNGFQSTVVRLMKVVDAEEKLDEALLNLENVDDLPSDSEHLQGRIIKKYREKYFNILSEKISDEIKAMYTEQNKDFALVLKSFDGIIDTLVFVHDEIVPLFPARCSIFNFFVLEYHRGIYITLNTMTAGEIDPAMILILIKWVKDYYLGMSQRLGMSDTLLAPRLLDGRESDYMEKYVKLVRVKLTEWLKNILATETIDFLERKCPPETDTNGQYLLTGSVIVFQMFNQQLDVVATTDNEKLLSDIVFECCSILEQFQTAWIKIVDGEYSKFTHKSNELGEGLVEYIMALANDSMRSTEFSEAITNRLSEMSKENAKDNIAAVTRVLNGFTSIQKKCTAILIEIVMLDLKAAIETLHCPTWYEQDIMKLIVGTIEDYFDDFKKHMADYLFNKMVSEIIDKLLIPYIESFKNRNIKVFKMPTALERMRSDLELMIIFFSRNKTAKRVKASFDIVEKVIKLFESDSRTLYIDFYQLRSQFPDFPIEYLEKIISKRDDLKKEDVKTIMELCREKIKEEVRPEFEPTIFSKISIK